METKNSKNLPLGAIVNEENNLEVLFDKDKKTASYLEQNGRYYKREKHKEKNVVGFYSLAGLKSFLSKFVKK